MPYQEGFIPGRTILNKVSEESFASMYKCDNCKNIFFGDQILLQKFKDGFSLKSFLTNFVFASEKEGRCISFNDTDILDKDDTHYTLHCPICKHVHLSGFDKVKS